LPVSWSAAGPGSGCKARLRFLAMDPASSAVCPTSDQLSCDAWTRPCRLGGAAPRWASCQLEDATEAGSSVFQHWSPMGGLVARDMPINHCSMRLQCT
jgi:hypothetical protein